METHLSALQEQLDALQRDQESLRAQFSLVSIGGASTGSATDDDAEYVSAKHILIAPASTEVAREPVADEGERVLTGEARSLEPRAADYTKIGAIAPDRTFSFGLTSFDDRTVTELLMPHKTVHHREQAKSRAAAKSRRTRQLEHKLQELVNPQPTKDELAILVNELQAAGVFDTVSSDGSRLRHVVAQRAEEKRAQAASTALRHVRAAAQPSRAEALTAAARARLRRIGTQRLEAKQTAAGGGAAAAALGRRRGSNTDGSLSSKHSDATARHRPGESGAAPSAAGSFRPQQPERRARAGATGSATRSVGSGGRRRPSVGSDRTRGTWSRERSTDGDTPRTDEHGAAAARSEDDGGAAGGAAPTMTAPVLRISRVGGGAEDEEGTEGAQSSRTDGSSEPSSARLSRLSNASGTSAASSNCSADVVAAETRRLTALSLGEGEAASALRAARKSALVHVPTEDTGPRSAAHDVEVDVRSGLHKTKNSAIRELGQLPYHAQLKQHKSSLAWALDEAAGGRARSEADAGAIDGLSERVTRSAGGMRRPSSRARAAERDARAPPKSAPHPASAARGHAARAEGAEAAAPASEESAAETLGARALALLPHLPVSSLGHRELSTYAPASARRAGEDSARSRDSAGASSSASTELPPLDSRRRQNPLFDRPSASALRRRQRSAAFEPQSGLAEEDEQHGGADDARVSSADQRRAYLRACEALPAGQVPVARVLNKLGAHSLVLRHYGLGEQGGTAFAAALALNRTWHTVDLSDNQLHGVGGEAVARAVAENDTLEELDLADNKLGERGMLVLSDVLHRGGAVRLHTLNLRGNLLRDEGANALVRALAGAARGLLSLNVATNDLGASAARSLGFLIQQGLVGELEVGWNRLGGDGALELLAGMRHALHPKRLLLLGLSWNGLGERGGIAAGEMLRTSPGLRTLDLQHNGIEETAAVVIAAGIEESPALESLELGHNPLGRVGLEAIVRALEHTDTLSHLGLQAVEAQLDDMGEHLTPFDPKSPAGEYTLDLTQHWDRWIAEQLRTLALTEPGGGWAWATLDDGSEAHFSRASAYKPIHLDSEWELPQSGTLRLEYEQREPRPTSVVHYRLDLSDERDRLIARSLWTRALAEPGENWRNSRINGHAFHLDESRGALWEVPEVGILELDYATFALKYEEHYALELSRRDDRAVLRKLLERAGADEAENFLNENLNGRAYQLPDDAEAVKRFVIPEHGRLEFDFVCTEPKHVSTRHYCLDLSVRAEWELAERLRQWALFEPGENWTDVTLDGDPIEFNEDAPPGEPLIVIRKGVVNRQRDITAANRKVKPIERRPNLPRRGVLEFDYVVLQPRTATAASRKRYRLDLAKKEDRAIAETLKQLGADMRGENWFNETIDGVALNMNEDDPTWELPSSGLLELDFQDTVEYESPRVVSENELQLLLQTVEQRQGSAAELDQLDLLDSMVDAMHLSAEQISRVVRQVESEQGRQRLALRLFDRCIDRNNYRSVAAELADGDALLEEIKRTKLPSPAAHVTQWTKATSEQLPAPPVRRQDSRERQISALRGQGRPGSADGPEPGDADFNSEAERWRSKYKVEGYEVWPDEGPAAQQQAQQAPGAKPAPAPAPGRPGPGRSGGAQPAAPGARGSHAPKQKASGAILSSSGSAAPTSGAGASAPCAKVAGPPLASSSRRPVASAVAQPGKAAAGGSQPAALARRTTSTTGGTVTTGGSRRTSRSGT